jgi:hypothetical protein
MPTWVGTISTDWNTAGNWTLPAAVPTAATAAIFTGTPVNNCTTGTVARACLTLDTTGYLGTLEIGSSTAGVLNVSGNVTIGNSVGHITGLAYLQIQANSSLNISTGVTLPNLGLILGTVTMLSNVVVNNILVSGFRNLNGAFDLTINGNAQGGTVINATAGRKVTVTASSTGTSTLTTFSINNFIFEIACSNRNISLTGISIYTSCTINYLATNTGGFTTTGHTLSYSTTSINMFGSTNSWNIISANASSTLTLLSDVYCVQFGPTLADTINGIGFFICATTTGALSTLLGNAGLRFVGGSNGTWNQINTNSLARIEFAKTGVANVNIPNSFTKNGGVIQYVSGAVTHTATATLSGSVTMDTTSAVAWNNITIAASATITISSLLSITGSLLCSGTATFAGTHGWTTGNFSHAGAGLTCTLQAGNTYTVNGVLTMIGTAASRAILQSSNAVAVTASIASLSNQLVVTVGTPTPPAAGYVLGSTSTALPIALNNLLPDRPTIASGAASPYTLVSAIGATALASGSYTLGKKAFLIVTNGTGSTNVAYVTTRDIDSNGGITVLAFSSYSDSIGQPSANLFRTLNWGPLVAPSGSVYYTFVN